MASKDVFFRGKCKFFKLLDKGDVEYQCWNTVLYLDAESYATFLELKKGNDTTDGIMNEAKLDDDGHYISLKRPWTRKYKGQDVGFTPPVVLDKNNMPWPSDKWVGHGSDVTIKCEYYTFKPPFKQKRGSAIRLVSARIEDYVPYEPKRDLTEHQVKATAGLEANAAKPTQYF